MTFRKAIAVVLAATQVSFGTLAFAGETNTATTNSATPEFTLLQNVFSMQGQNLQGTQRADRISKMLAQYTATAPEQGREARMQKALVQLGIYTTAQATQFMTAARDAETQVRNVQTTTADLTQTVLSSEIMHLAQLRPSGAQFSSCDLSTAGMIAAGAGVATLIAGLVLRYDNPTCYNQYLGSSDSCYYDSNGNYFCGTTDVYGPTICEKQDYYPHRSLGNGLLIGGGVAAAVGAIILFTNQNC